MHSSLMVFISSSFLAQLVIPTYGATLPNDLIRSCDNSDNWIGPDWPENILEWCQGILSTFENIEPEVHSIRGPQHEFLPVGMAQKPFEGRILEPVRTPWKLSNGALFPRPLAVLYLVWVVVFPYSGLMLVDVSGPCTMAVTPLDRKDSDLLPRGFPLHRYPESGVITWRSVYYNAVDLVNICLRLSRDAGIVWLDSSNPLPLDLNLSRH